MITSDNSPRLKAGFLQAFTDTRLSACGQTEGCKGGARLSALNVLRDGLPVPTPYIQLLKGRTVPSVKPFQLLALMGTVVWGYSTRLRLISPSLKGEVLRRFFDNYAVVRSWKSTSVCRSASKQGSRAAKRPQQSKVLKAAYTSVVSTCGKRKQHVHMVSLTISAAKICGQR